MAHACCHWRLFALLTGSLVTLRIVEAAPAPGALLVEKENVVEAQARGAGWKPAAVGTALAVHDKLRTGEFSRAAAQFGDRSVLRIDELTTIEISPPSGPAAKGVLNLLRGGTYFFSREKPQEIRLRTPAVNGALRGTEFELRVRADGYTALSLFEGEVELSNAQGTLVLRSGERGEVAPGQRPRKTAMIEAVNIIQWCLYYPGVVDPADLKLEEERALTPSLKAYRTGDLLGALTRYPASRGGGGSAAERVYRASVMLSVGQVEKARGALSGVPAGHPGRKALEQMIAAVKFQSWTSATEPATASEWLAESYYRQSQSDLEAALRAARRARELSPEFGFAATRVAELEFAFGRVPQAQRALKEGLDLAPRHAQGHALQGFLLSAQNHLDAARRSFDDAIALDGALGNAWLGRGLIAIRRGDEEAGLRDLQVAAALEPNRSLLRSYLAKAYSTADDSAHAHAELKRAIEIDPRDPTPWLYSAVQKSQENRYNEAIADLERSIELNDNRSVFRSRFLLDQDRSIRGTNLASIYRNNDMIEQSLREAVSAVGADYSSAPAHLFLANSYNALRDPNRILLRYETAWFNELLLSNLLSPVGGGPLSQFVTEQEYSKMFEQDGLGFSSVTDYFSTGELRETASQYGTFGNVSYALDAEYFYNDGLRPNNRISRSEAYATFKLQLGPQDTLFLQTKYADLETGDVFQRYDEREVSLIEEADGLGGVRKIPNRSALTFDFRERQEPALLLAGWHHAWDPSVHSLFLVGRLANEQRFTSLDTRQNVLFRDVTTLVPAGFDIDVSSGAIAKDGDYFDFLRDYLGRGRISRAENGIFDVEYEASFEVLSAEFQQIFESERDTLIFGARYQSGEFETRTRLTDYNNGEDAFATTLVEDPPARQFAQVDFERINLYAYNIWRPAKWLSITTGITYDELHYPENFRSVPINDQQAKRSKVSPKIGTTIRPWAGATIRGGYAEAISGTSFDESVRLEPTQFDGLLQAYRTVISESLVGSIAGGDYRLSHVSLEQKLPTRTYLGLSWEVLRQDVDRTNGTFERLEAGGIPLAVLPASLPEENSYREDAITATVNQLLGREWSIGFRYRYTRSKLRTQRAGFSDAFDDQLAVDALPALAELADRTMESGLHNLSLSVAYNHPCGFFAGAKANWYRQENDDAMLEPNVPPTEFFVQQPELRTVNQGLPGDDFWQVDAVAGYRFSRNRCEVACGVLNLTDQDYRLQPLNPYLDLPRDRTLFVRFRVEF